jgi:hypothetical protein
MNGIFCLMFSGRGLTNEVRTFLYRTACEMHQKSTESLKVRTEHCEGIVRTNFSFAMMDTVGGTKFIADVETEAGQTHTGMSPFFQTRCPSVKGLVN